MKRRLSLELEGIVGAVEILSPTRFRVGERVREVGGPGPLFVPSPRDPAATEESEEALRRALTDELYCWSYLRARAETPPPQDLGAYRDHLLALTRANASSGTWEPGWRIQGIAADGRVAVVGHDMVFTVAADEVRPESGRLAAGEACWVRVPGEMRALRPGFYSALGDAEPAAAEDLPWRVRLYWHLLPSGAPLWLQAVTRGLNERNIPFQLKVVADPRFYLRADAGVLTLEPDHYRAARPVLQRAYRAVRGHLRPVVPGLTLELAPGLGVAEGGADGSSFGAHRCDLIAAALVGLGAETTDSRLRLAVVAEGLRAAGLDPAAPHRAPGSTTRYRALVRSERVPARRGTESSPARDGSPPEGKTDLVAAAARIGDRLCRGAYRFEGRCNWLGRVFVGDSPVPAVGALGPGVYGGTAGIALFLADLHEVTRDPDHRATALGAIRQALKAAEKEPGRIRPVSFYEGQLGIGWAARRVAARVGDSALATAGDVLVSSIARELPGEHRWDLLDGHAGAILALLRLHEETGEKHSLAAAEKLGRALAAAQTSGGPIPAAPGQPPLTGFAHGAAGVGVALLELAVATGESELRDAADRCFAYEADCFDTEHRNWPDYRAVVLDPAGALVPAPGFMTAWCHGAAGIALSRLRAMEVDPERAASYEPAARAGLATTVAAIESRVVAEPGERGLCHGLAGLADVASIGARVLGDSPLGEHATRAIEGVAAWPEQGQAGDGPERLEDPSLMTGVAGVGHALLRFAEPERFATMLLPAAAPSAGGREVDCAGAVVSADRDSAPDRLERSRQ